MLQQRIRESKNRYLKTENGTPNTACTHCGLPVPAGLIKPESVNQFCCSGCDGAYDLIHSSGLGSFYRMANSDSMEQAKPVVDSQTGFAEFDEVVFQAKCARRLSAEESTIELAIDGIHCGACIWLIEKLPMIQSGVVSATANWTQRTVKIRWRKKLVPLSKIAKKLNQLGYRPSPIQPNQRRSRWKIENRNHLIRIGISAACAGNNMIIAAALYLGMFSHMTSGMTGLLRGASCVVGVIALLWPGRVFLQSAAGALRTRTPHMDLPIALGLTVGTIAGFANVIRGTGEIYFDSLSVLIFLLLIGRWIQFRQQSKATDAIELLFRLTPQMARKLVDGKPVEMLVDLVVVGDLLEVYPGELFPVDAKVVGGETHADESILTGESESVFREVGDCVSAGTTNINSPVTIRANAIGRETRLSQIVDLVEQASLERPEIVQWANKVGGYFVVVVIVLAVLTFAFWSLFSIEAGIDRTIALLIVACPCALALATPLAIAVSLGRAAKKKIMIKGGDVLQSLQRPGTIWLDKTGTLTEGDLSVVSWYGDTRWVDVVASLENQSPHPVAKALVEYATNVWTPHKLVGGEKLTAWELHALQSELLVRESQSVEGQGIRGKVGRQDVLVGNEKLLRNSDIFLSQQHERIAARVSESGLSPCWVAANGIVVAIVALGDAVRPDAFDAINQLKDRGWKVGILSGDHQHVVSRVAKRLGVHPEYARGGVEPEGKLSMVKSTSQNGTVVMVGDGVNDSAALAAADVGVAVNGGAEASLAAAPVYLGAPGLQPVLTLLAISDSTSQTMRVNLGVSLAYNISFAALAFAGFINPLVAAILMPVSSLTVVALSLSSGRIDESKTIERDERRGLET